MGNTSWNTRNTSNLFSNVQNSSGGRVGPTVCAIWLLRAVLTANWVQPHAKFLLWRFHTCLWCVLVIFTLPITLSSPSHQTSSLQVPHLPCMSFCLVGWLVGWLAGWLVGWLVCRLVGWLVGWLVLWLVGWLVSWLVDWLVVWLTGWLTGWLVGWLAGWLVAWLVG